MTVEIEYSIPNPPRNLGGWQLDMAKQIEENHNFPISDTERELSGTAFTLRAETDLPNQAVENMLSDIEEYLPDTAAHVETREV